MIFKLLSANPQDIEDVFDSIKSMTPRALLERSKTALIDFLPGLAGALLLLVIAYFTISGLLKLIKRFLKASRIDATLHSFIIGTIKYISWIIAVIMALLILRVPVSPLVAVLGSVGLAFSLALRDSLANLTGGISILFNRPFLKGDLIEVKGAVGKVHSIELFYTRIMTDNDKTVYLPNGDIAKSIVTNYSAEPLKRIEFTFSVSADMDFETVKEIITGVIAGTPRTLTSPPPVVAVSEKNGGGCKISCKTWVKAEHYDDILAQLQGEVTKRFERKE